MPYPNSEIEIKGSAHPSCDTWYAFLSALPTTSKTNVYAPKGTTLSVWTPGQNFVPRGAVRTTVSPPIRSYLWVTYSRNDQTQYGTDSGNAWPEYVKINGEDGFKYPSNRYDYMNKRSKSLRDYADAIKLVCGRYGIKVVDMYGDCPINPEVTAHVRAFIPDGTHPTPAGHELMGKYAAGVVAQVIP